MLGFFTGDKTRDQQDFSLGGRGTEWCARWRYGPHRGLRHRRHPGELIDGLIEQGARELTVVNNNAGNGDTGWRRCSRPDACAKIICSFPRQVDSQVFDALYRSGQLELELVPQGNLAERLRAAGAGIGAFFTPHGFRHRTRAQCRRQREGNPRDQRQVLCAGVPDPGDVALIKAERGDRWGNLTYRKAARNFGPSDGHRRQTHHRQRVRDRGTRRFDPEAVVTPGIHVSAVVRIPACHGPVASRLPMNQEIQA